MFKRAWNLSGLAIRSAQALGLHLRDISESLTVEMKEFRANNWFALMTLENMLTLMTGRPSMINLRDCSVPIPRSLAEGGFPSTPTSPSESSLQKSAMSARHRTSSPGSGKSEHRQGSVLNRVMKHDTSQTAGIYFVHYAELCMLAKEAVGELYQPGIRKQKQSAIQRKIEGFDRRLFEWKDGVKPPFDVASPSRDRETESCGVALRIIFHSTRIIINRPCLCRVKERIKSQSNLKWKNLNSANKCVESARATINLIIHKPESTVLHEGTMWWTLLHHLKRALTVLLLELAFRAEHMPADAGEILTEAKAAVNWLKYIGNSSPDARHTCSSMRKLLRLAAQKVGGDTSDMATSSSEEDETGPVHPEHQQPLLAGYEMAQQSAFPPRHLQGDATPMEQWQYYGDMMAQNELDQFGFLRAEGGMGSLFPTASEMEVMDEGHEEDYDMEGIFDYNAPNL